MDNNLRKSFATLARHHKSGNFNRGAALRLLRNNARDIGLTGRQAETQAAQWLNQLLRKIGT